MSKAQKALRDEIEKINDESAIEKVKIFVMGILAQQSLEERSKQEINFIQYNYQGREGGWNGSENNSQG